MNKIVLSAICFLSTFVLKAQQVAMSISGGTHLVVSGGSKVVMDTGAFVNNGVYTDDTGAFIAAGGVAFSGSGVTQFHDLRIANTQVSNVNNLVSVRNNTSIESGTINANGNLFIRSDVSPAANMMVAGVLNNTVQGLVTRASASSGTSGYTSLLSHNVSGPVMQYQWQLSSDSTTWSDISGATNVTYPATVTSSQFYRCRLATTNSGYNQSTPGVYLVTSGPGSIEGTLSLCAGTTTSLFNTATGGTWSSANPTVASVDSVSGMVIGIAVGTATISYTTSGGIATAVVTVNMTPSVIIGATTLCEGQTTTLTTMPGGGFWSSSSPSVAPVNFMTGVVAGNSGGSAIINYTTSAGCTSATVVTVNPAPVSIGGMLSVCEGASTTLYNATIGGIWTSDDGTIATIGFTNGVLMGVTPGTSMISYTLPTGCYAMAMATVNAAPPAITGTTSICMGTSATLSNAVAGGAWTSSNDSVATVGFTNGLVMGVSSGTATITYIAPSGCYRTTEVTINAAAAFITGAGDLCIGTTYALSTAATGGIWSSSDTGVVTVTATGEVSGSSVGVAAIIYTLPGGCFASTVVTVHMTPSSITGATTLCEGTTTALSEAFVGGFWSSGNPSVAAIDFETGVVTSSSAGTAMVSFTSWAGCTSTTIVTINVTPAPIEGLAGVCIGSASTLYNASAGGFWISNNDSVATVGFTNGILVGVAPGTSTISYMLPTGCYVTTTATVYSAPSIASSATICPGATATLGDSTMEGTWTSSNDSIAVVGFTSGIVTGVSAGWVTITYQSFSGCIATSMVSVYPTPSAGSITGASVVCAGSSVMLSGSVGGGTWSSSNPAVVTIDSAGMVTGMAAGSALIYYTVPGVCGYTETSALITVNSAGTVSPISGLSSVCTGSSIFLSDSTSGGTWSSSNPATATVDSMGMVAGVDTGSVIISYTVTGLCGSSTVTASVIVNPLPSAGAIAGASSVNVGSTISLASTVTGGTWTSSNAAVATVTSSGVLSGVSAGTVTISYAKTNSCGTAVAVKVVTVDPLCETWTNVASGGFSTTVAHRPALAVDASGTPYVAYRDNTNKISVKKYDGSNWVMVGSAGFSTGSVEYCAIAVDGSGTPYVAYQDVPASSLATVKKYDGSSWVTVGSTGFSGYVEYVSLAIDGSGTPYIACKDNGIGKAVVKKYDGSSWITVGGTAASSGTAEHVSLTLDASGIPYVSYSDYANGARATVRKYDGTSWSPVGGVAFSADVAFYTSIAIDNSGAPYVAYRDQGYANKATVMKYNGTSWSVVGTPGFSTGMAPFIRIAIDGATPYVAYRDDDNANKITVMKYAGGAWATSGVFTTGDYPAIAVNGSGMPYVTYSEGTGGAAKKLAPTVSPITGSSTVCTGVTTTLGDATPAGTWSSSSPAIAAIGSSSGIVSGVAVGTAVVTYTAGGCNNTKVVTVNALPSAGAITGASSVNVGSTTSLTSTVAGGTWTSSNSTIASVNSAGVVSGLTTGVVTISYTVSNSCGTATATKVVTVNGAAVTGASTVCVGATATLSGMPAGGSWTSSNTARATVSAVGVVTGVAAGTVVITYNASSSVTTTVVTVNASPTITGTASVCVGTAATLTGSGGGTWSSSATEIAAIGSTGIVTGNIPGTAIIEYTLTNGCKATKIATVNISPESISGPTTVCVGATMTLVNSVPGGSWTSSSTGLATVGTAGNVTGVAVGTPVITYAIGVCRAIQTVNVLASPALIGGTAKACPGTTATLTDATVGGVWSSSDPTIATVSATGIVNGVAAGTANVFYTLTNGCSRSTTATINPNPADIAGAGAVCVGATASLSSATAGLTWSSSDNSKATVGISSGVVSGVAAGTAKITYKNTTTGCLTTTVIAVNAAPPAISGTAWVCPGAVTSLSNTATGGTWSSNDPTIATIDGTTGVVTGVVAGTTTIVYTIGGGCSRSVVVTINAGPAISGSLAVCVGKSTLLTSSPPASSWVSSNTTVAPVGSGSVSGMTVGTANITATTGTGCKTVVTVSVDALPPAISGTLATCVGSTTTLSNVMSGGTWSSYAPANASINSSGVVTGLIVSNVMITYTSGAGCVRTGAVTVNAAPTIAGTATICEGASVILSAGGSGTWSSSALAQAVVGSTGIVTGVLAGTATISYTSAIGCQASRVVTVNVCSSRQAITGIGNAELNTQISMFPNPTSGMITIQSPEAGMLSVLAVDGKEVASFHIAGGDTNIILPKDLAAGVYMCHFNGSEGGRATVKLIYQH